MISKPTTDALEALLDQMEKLAVPPEQEWLAQVAKEMSKIFRVQVDEVAVLELTEDGEALKFVLPEKLSLVGEIPLTSPSALAARSVRERRSEIVNSFSSARHATVFEGVPLGRMPEESIHKIMSTPITFQNKVVGVAQISHKGLSPIQCGSDFSSEDLAKLKSLNDLLARLLMLRTMPATNFVNDAQQPQPALEVA